MPVLCVSGEPCKESAAYQSDEPLNALPSPGLPSDCAQLAKAEEITFKAKDTHNSNNNTHTLQLYELALWRMESEMFNLKECFRYLIIETLSSFHKDMYDGATTTVRSAAGLTEEFKVGVGLHQRSALSPFLFAIIMDKLSEDVEEDAP